MKSAINHIALATLLITRYLSEYFFIYASDSEHAVLCKVIAPYIICILIFLVTWVNRDNLNGFNFDQPFFFILLVNCFFLVWGYFPFAFGVFMLMVNGIFIFEYSKKTYRFSESTFFSPNIFALVICVIVIPLLISNYNGRANINYEKVLPLLASQNLFGVIFEEFLFRGLLWQFLKNLDLAQSKIIMIQGTLFWLAHYHLLFNGSLSFWTTIPLVSIILGMLIFRSKSLTVSTLAHFLYNFLVGVFSNSL